jgi:hypothetical protein
MNLLAKGVSREPLFIHFFAKNIASNAVFFSTGILEKRIIRGALKSARQGV